MSQTKPVAPLNIVGISIVAHEAVSAFKHLAHSIPMENLLHWDDVDQGVRFAFIQQTMKIVDGEHKTLREDWDAWYNELIADGWKNGEIYSEESKVMYGLLTYDEMRATDHGTMDLVAEQIHRDVVEYLISLRESRPQNKTFFSELSPTEKVLELARLVRLCVVAFVRVIHGDERAEMVNHPEYSTKFHDDYIVTTKEILGYDRDSIHEARILIATMSGDVGGFSTTEISSPFLAVMALSFGLFMVGVNDGSRSDLRPVQPYPVHLLV